MVNLECNSAHPKDNSCEVSLQSDQKNIFLTIMVTRVTVAILKTLNAHLHVPKIIPVKMCPWDSVVKTKIYSKEPQCK
jgi:hypothetical protein